MPTSIIVADDFFSDAEGFREAGLRLAYPDQPGSLFPGRNSAERLQIEGLEQHVSQLTGERLRPLPTPSGHAKPMPNRSTTSSAATRWIPVRGKRR